MVGIMTVLNPRAPRRRKKRKMSAKQLRFFGPKRKRAKAAKGKVVIVSENPRRRRKRKAAPVARKRRSVARVKRNPSKRRFRRNPLPSSMSGFLNQSLVPAAIGAAGAVAVDYLLAVAPIPDSMRSPATLPLWRIAAAFGVGFAVSYVAGSKAGSEATAGGLTVAAYAMARNFMANNMPGVPLARYVKMNRYLGMRGMGYVRRGQGLKGAQQQRLRNLGIRRIRRLQGLKQKIDQGIAANAQMLNGLGPVRNTFPNGGSRLGAGNPANVTKFRVLRDGSTMDDSMVAGARATGLGYIGPGRTLGRYLGQGR